MEFTVDNFTGKILRRQSGIVIGAGSQLGNFNGYVDNVSTVLISLFHQWFVLVEILWRHSLFVGFTACDFRIRVDSHKSKPLHFQSSEYHCVCNKSPSRIMWSFKGTGWNLVFYIILFKTRWLDSYTICEHIHKMMGKIDMIIFVISKGN